MASTGSGRVRRCMGWQMKNGGFSAMAAAFCAAAVSISSEISAPMTR